MMRTTCVATQIEGGHAPNALPQRAQANVNCRILPGVPIETVQDDLRRVVADDGIRISPTGNRGLVAPVPPCRHRSWSPIKKVAADLWPGVPIIPTMSAGATDGRFLNAAGIPTYGLSGMFSDAAGSRAHGLERTHPRTVAAGRAAVPVRGRQALRAAAGLNCIEITGVCSQEARGSHIG